MYALCDTFITLLVGVFTFGLSRSGAVKLGFPCFTLHLDYIISCKLCQALFQSFLKTFFCACFRLFIWYFQGACKVCINLTPLLYHAFYYLSTLFFNFFEKFFQVVLTFGKYDIFKGLISGGSALAVWLALSGLPLAVCRVAFDGSIVA